MSNLNIDCIIGIDPGATGGIAIWRANGEVKALKMPKDIMELKQYFEHLKQISQSPVIFIEKLQMRPDDILQGEPTEAQQKAHMGKAYRIQKMLEASQQLKSLAEFCGIPYILVHPMSWQSYLHLRVKGEEKKDRKNRYKRAAAEYYPGLKVNLQNADALLLMHFGRMKKQQDPNWILENLPKRVHSKIEFNQQ